MKVVAALLLILALVVGVVPQFTDCESQGRHITTADGREIPMKCHWTARAEIALAVPLFAVGSLSAFSDSKRNRRALGFLAAVLGILVALLPTALIGVCGNPDMICNSFMKPFLIFTGGLTAVGGLALIFWPRAQA
ncbi:MAG TPA: DUF4418 family protein [Anaerolineales bacterium]|nr:DUF4418 family protein [Anaerolineales bacterium]